VAELSEQVSDLKYKVQMLEREVEKLNALMQDVLDNRKDIYQLFESRRTELSREIKDIYDKINEIDCLDANEIRKTLGQIQNLKWMVYGGMFVLGWIFSNADLSSFLKFSN
jgi:predicted  nucleic acid-binding Zn-ribbon protein